MKDTTLTEKIDDLMTDLLWQCSDMGKKKLERKKTIPNYSNIRQSILQLINSEVKKARVELIECVKKQDVWGKDAIINSPEYVRGYKGALEDTVSKLKENK